MQFKVKALVGAYQCIAAVPVVFNVSVPPGLEQYTRWVNILEFAFNYEDMLVPSACWGSCMQPATRIWASTSQAVHRYDLWILRPASACLLV
jgi:hypothetical protein|eukprot:5835962-Prymnesium_polylepis.2